MFDSSVKLFIHIRLSPFQTVGTNSRFRPQAKLYNVNGRSYILYLQNGKPPKLIDPMTLEWTDGPPHLEPSDCPWAYPHYVEDDALLIVHAGFGQMCLFDGDKWHATRAFQRQPRQIIYAGTVIPRHLFCP